jgi:hypothetical protein
LKEIQFGNESGEDLALKEKQFNLLLNDIKLRSDNLRRKKLHQVPSKMKKPVRGLPSFISPKDSAGEIEEILSRKVKQQTVKEFLGTTQNSVGEENFSVASHHIKISP